MNELVTQTTPREVFGRMDEILFGDPTRQLQMLCGIAAILRSFWLLYFPISNWPVGPARETDAAVFYVINEHQWALVFFVAGVAQFGTACVSRYRWRWKYYAAIAQSFIVMYAAMCYWLTVPWSSTLSFMLTILIAELWIALRALHDREINGSDRRGTKPSA